MPKWEYCCIRAFDPANSDYAGFYRLTNKGSELVTEFKTRPKGVTRADAFAQLIAQLGDEGWEMVGAGNIAEQAHCLYFRRSKT